MTEEKVSIGQLLDVNVIHVLTYLRAVDIASACAANKTIFSKRKVSCAIELLMSDVYNFLPQKDSLKGSSFAFGVNYLERLPILLYEKEISCIRLALSAPQPLHPKGFSL
jgi:hypothetical protein